MNNLIFKSEYVIKDIVVVVGSEDKEYDSVIVVKIVDILFFMVGINVVFVIIKWMD